jgi:hypothetical protein
MRIWHWLSLVLVTISALAETNRTVMLVVGAPGEPEYGSNFVRQVEAWKSACEKGQTKQVVIGLGEGAQTNDLETLKTALASESKEGAEELWLVLIGHGTFDGKESRFNLRGPDISGSELAAMLKPFHRPMAILNMASCSAPFLNKLAGTNRVIISATRSGNEQSFARFGEYFSEAIGNPEADLDKDGEVSLLEAFLIASREALDFYKNAGRMATEHALLDDNGDGLGTPADWFRGVRAIKKPEKAAVDGLLANQFCLIRSEMDANLSLTDRARRDALERQVLQLRDKKSQMAEPEYYSQLEKLLRELAKFYGGAAS